MLEAGSVQPGTQLDPGVAMAPERVLAILHLPRWPVSPHGTETGAWPWSQPRWETIRGMLTPGRPDVSQHRCRHHRQPWPQGSHSPSAGAALEAACLFIFLSSVACFDGTSSSSSPGPGVEP